MCNIILVLTLSGNVAGSNQWNRTFDHKGLCQLCTNSFLLHSNVLHCLCTADKGLTHS